MPPDQVAGLAEMAAGQERALRRLVLRDPDEGPTGAAPLRAALEALAARAWGRLEVTAGATGPIWLPAHQVEELAAAARQALENVVAHAGASRAALFAEEDGGAVVVTVRDDGPASPTTRPPSPPPARWAWSRASRAGSSSSAGTCG